MNGYALMVECPLPPMVPPIPFYPWFWGPTQLSINSLGFFETICHCQDDENKKASSNQRSSKENLENTFGKRRTQVISRLSSFLSWQNSMFFNCFSGHSIFSFFGFFFFFFFVFLPFLGPLSVAYGGSQVRGPIGAVATGLYHSHSNDIYILSE